MKRSSFLLTAVLATSFAFTACDSRRSPGADPQRQGSFADAPDARATETDLDSVNSQQTAPMPTGTGSATDINSSTDAALNSAPAGSSATTPEAPSGRTGNAPSNPTGSAQNKNGMQAPANASPTTTPPNGNQ